MNEQNANSFNFDSQTIVTALNLRLQIDIEKNKESDVSRKILHYFSEKELYEMIKLITPIVNLINLVNKDKEGNKSTAESLFDISVSIGAGTVEMQRFFKEHNRIKK